MQSPKVSIFYTTGSFWKNIQKEGIFQLINLQEKFRLKLNKLQVTRALLSSSYNSQEHLR